MIAFERVLLVDPNFAGARLDLAEALENLRVLEQTQRLLRTNAQEALTLEVGLLKLRL